MSVHRRAIWSHTLTCPGASTRNPHDKVKTQNRPPKLGYLSAIPSAVMAATRSPVTVALRMNSSDIMQGKAIPRIEARTQIA